MQEKRGHDEDIEYQMINNTGLFTMFIVIKSNLKKVNTV
jgi:hypothetical protein